MGWWTWYLLAREARAHPYAAALLLLGVATVLLPRALARLFPNWSLVAGHATLPPLSDDDGEGAALLHASTKAHKQCVPIGTVQHGTVILAAPSSTVGWLKLAGGLGYVKQTDELLPKLYGQEGRGFGWVEQAAGEEQDAANEQAEGGADGPAGLAVEDVRKKCANCSRQRRELRAEGKSLRNCGRCLAIFYCSADCQKEHWFDSHRRVCQPLARLHAER